MFNILELVSLVSNFFYLYLVIYEIIGDFMEVENFFVVFCDVDSEFVNMVYFVDEFDE